MKTYGSLRLKDSGHWVMDQIPPHVAIRLKHIFPRIRKTDVAPFFFPHDDKHCADLQWFVARYPLQIGHADLAVLNSGACSYVATQNHLEALLSPDYKPGDCLTGLRDGQEVRTYQRQAIEVLLRRRDLLLGDDLGLGKTYTALGFLLYPQARPGAVVVQTHLPGQWQEKLEAFTTMNAHQIKGTKPYDLPKADVYIYRYSQLAGWVDVFATGLFKTAVFDEIQELRTGLSSQKGAAANVLARHAAYRLGLSATPIYNYGSEIWNIYNCALDPAVLGSYPDFEREWLSQGRTVTNPEALGTYLREQHVFVRRTKKDVGQQAPPVNRLVETIDSDPRALANIEALARQLAMKATSGSFMERGQAGRELDLLVRQATGVGKAKSVAAYARILLTNGVRLMLCGWHRDVYDIWLRELAEFKPVMYTGSESPKQKAESKRQFVDGVTNCFILSLRSGAGLDGLQHNCSTVIFGELDWSPKVHEQIIGRLDREGQQEQVTAVFLNSDDGSDPPMVELLGLKASQSRGIVDPGVALPSPHSDDSRIKLLAQRYLDQLALERRAA